uniref:Uncharacterized protein n=1 Tax=Pelusios castaneus TaxID=367368 RepID=A0A8C8VEC7_9SAUR
QPHHLRGMRSPSPSPACGAGWLLRCAPCAGVLVGAWHWKWSPRLGSLSRSSPQTLDQWFSTFLMPRPFNTVPSSCCGSFDPQRGPDPQVENHCSRRTQLPLWIMVNKAHEGVYEALASAQRFE